MVQRRAAGGGRRAAGGVIAAVVAGVATLGGAKLVASRSGVSLRAWLVGHLAAVMAPDLGEPAAMSAAIEKDRRRGPALPSKAILRRRSFRDEGHGADRTFRVRRRRSADPRLRILYLHGGAYILDLQPVQWNLIDGMLERLEAEIVVPIFPLAPEHGWVEGTGAVRRAYLSEAAQHGADNVVILADSAGGGLALALVQQLRDEGRGDLPAALALLSPWLDIGASGEDQPEIERHDPALRIAFLRRAGDLWARGLDRKDPRVSPLFGTQENLPPTIVLTGSRDILDSDARRLAVANPAIILRRYPGMIHVWLAAPIPEAALALDEVAAFVREHTHGSWLGASSIDASPTAISSR